MRPRWAVVVTASCFFFAVAPQASADTAAAADRQAVLSKYCFMCHNEKLKSGGLALSTIDLANLRKNPEKWEKVVRKLRTGAMPPGKMPRPDKATTETIVSGIETELDRAALDNPNPGRPSLQPLNSSEYRNAIRDLLALDIDAASMLPADAAGYGFDNNADALSLSPALTER